MLEIDLTHEGYAEAFADCEVGDTKTITFTVSKKDEDMLQGQVDLDSIQDAEPDEVGESAGAYEKSGSQTSKRMPRALLIAVGKMK